MALTTAATAAKVVKARMNNKHAAINRHKRNTLHKDGKQTTAPKLQATFLRLTNMTPPLSEEVNHEALVSVQAVRCPFRTTRRFPATMNKTLFCNPTCTRFKLERVPAVFSLHGVPPCISCPCWEQCPQPGYPLASHHSCKACLRYKDAGADAQSGSLR